MTESVTHPEPESVTPESVFEAAIRGAAERMLRDAGVVYAVVPKFGLDLGIFLQDSSGPRARFVEAKVFAAARPGGVGFGNQQGRGPQVDLLLCSEPELLILDSSVRWVLADATLPVGTARYAVFTCRTAKQAAMGGVRKGKQNNFRVSAFASGLLTWSQALSELRAFLLE